MHQSFSLTTPTAPRQTTYVVCHSACKPNGPCQPQAPFGPLCAGSAPRVGQESAASPKVGAAHPFLVSLVALTLIACDKTPPDPTWPPEPQVRPASDELAAQRASSAPLPLVSSVPAAENVLGSPATATKPDPTAGRSNSAMSRTQESTAMPLPGQNNDHSAPLNPPKAGSGPGRG